jgi:hypothetical protein
VFAAEQDRSVVLVGRLKCVFGRAVLAVIAVQNGVGDAVLDQVCIGGAADLDEGDVGDVCPALQGDREAFPSIEVQVETSLLRKYPMVTGSRKTSLLVQT